MSTPPKARLASATTLEMSAGRLASAASAMTSAPVFCFTSPAASLSAASPRAHITTRAPSAARPSALALPMPLLAATTSAVFPLMPRSIGSLPVRRSGTLLVEVGAVAAGDGQLADLVVAHHLEGHLLARGVAPEREVQLLAGGHLLRVERHDQVALLDARARPGAVRHEAGHHHAFLHRGGDDPEPGALGAAHHAAEAHELFLAAAVALGRDRERGAPDLVEVERDHAHHLPGHSEERAAPEAGVGRARDDPAIEQVLPVALVLAQVGHESAPHPPLAGPGRAEREDRRPAVD